MPKERYRLYHAEKAKGGIGLTMIGGSAVVAPDSPQAFGNILLYKDEVRALAQGARRRRACPRRRRDDPDHPSRPPHELGARPTGCRCWRPPTCASRPTAPSPRPWRTGTSPAIVAAYADAAERVKAGGLDGLELECYGHLIDQFWSPATNKRDDEYGGIARQPHALRLRGARAPSAARVGPDFIVGTRAGLRRGLGAAACRATEGLGIARRLVGLGPDRLRQRHPRPYRHRGGAEPRHPRHGRALGAASRLRRRGAGRDRACRPSTPPASRTSRPRATPSRAASSTWSA